MKIITLTLLLFLLTAISATAQIINIPDPVFKTELTTTNCVFVNGLAASSVDRNGDGEVQVSEALAVTELRLTNELTSDVTGLEAFTNLEEIVFLYYGGNSSWPMVFDFNQLTQLKKIDAYAFPFDVLNVSQLQNLEVLSFYFTGGLNDIDLSNNAQLRSFYVGPGGGSFATLDFSNCPLLESLFIDNGSVGSLNIKNGSLLNPNSFGVNATYICVDPQEEREISGLVNQNTIVNSYCSFTPGGDFNEMNGSTRFNTSGNCAPSDPLLSNIMYGYTDGNLTGAVYSNTGNYNIYVPYGSYAVTPQLENPSYWNITPPSGTVNFPAQTSPQTQDFCISANGSIEDLEVTIFEMSEPRPGFDVDYRVVVRNKGNQPASGTVTLEYQNDFMTLLSSSPVASTPMVDQLSWGFLNLNPLTNVSFDYTMTLNTPTAAVNPLDIGDFVNFTAIVNGTGTDAMPADNALVYDQEIINSYDPNDKTCLHGATITPSQVGDYVYYKIRFENLGTASAVNVVIKDEINLSQFDINTLVPLDSSHDYVTRVRDNNIVEFIFENINLDFNDATNDGYVVFKIKTLNTLVEGDTFDNNAGIYFDFNAPIITNTEVVTIMSTASIEEVTDKSVVIYPNPTNGILHINSKNNLKSTTLVDLNGRFLKQINFIGNRTNQQLDFSTLGKGIYFLTVTTDFGSRVEKLVIN
ncbi:putative repeat protein (TIGR01451 family)/predicted secreted protein (Por secretion system target) [Nonlabens dokdonensis]|jgi:hypothetical protein|uniref:Repeat protein (TIGR01451 family)/predicted secreted protein (Por secretion system target) n=2 Tax=Nonlabens dokdonensis TaxID=328515 RepID=A0ABX5Q2N9_9FLAO|nr:T9SS type A sorting domain-containing protein [Nonlabens dokdonensis]AGC76570.1 putative membrane-anchored cell surface protein [Nonlabens dokdonensis DSW-6]PZX44221.1 putative repeat protein (TIGR01451 family)/predicted secreted protein (Por secretion system target) [Nonlabens dokdonensis]